jgi:hypothetical protein
MSESQGSWPPPPPIDAPVVGRRTSGKAITSLVCGIIGLFVIPLILSILAIVFGIIARKDTERDASLGGRGMATAGLVLGIIGIVLAPILIILIYA